MATNPPAAESPALTVVTPLGPVAPVATLPPQRREVNALRNAALIAPLTKRRPPISAVAQPMSTSKAAGR